METKGVMDVQSAWCSIVNLPWPALGEAVKSIVLPLAAPLAALYVSNKFGHIQAETASLAMRTARSKVRLDLFHKRITVFEATDGILQKGLHVAS